MIIGDEIVCPKCKHVHEPSGDHEEDSGVWDCCKCEYTFKVQIDYDPTYCISCEDCDFPDWKEGGVRRWCSNCGKCELKACQGE